MSNAPRLFLLKKMKSTKRTAHWAVLFIMKCAQLPSSIPYFMRDAQLAHHPGRAGKYTKVLPPQPKDK